jgi:two-component system chemotaxis response regulator CheV
MRSHTFSTSAANNILLSAGTNEVEFMEFYLGGISYGINVAKILRVVGLKETPITRVAEAPRNVLGVIYDQGKPLKLIDLKGALNIDRPASDEDRRLVLITHFNSGSHAFLIDGIHKIHRTSWDSFQPMSSTLYNTEAYVTGTVQLENRIVLILDLERLIIDGSPNRSVEHVHLSEGTLVKRASRSIVFAEDSALIRRLTLETLTKAGYTRVQAFDNGETAWNHIQNEAALAKQGKQALHDRIQVLLTDIEMPKLDGLTLCKRVKTETGDPNPPAVLVYSSLINEDMRRKCKAVGTDRELSKPNTLDIIATLDEILFGSKLEDGDLQAKVLEEAAA